MGFVFKGFQCEKSKSFLSQKDQCDVCCEHGEGNISDAEYLDHIAKKNAAQLEKDKDKARCQADKTLRGQFNKFVELGV